MIHSCPKGSRCGLQRSISFLIFSAIWYVIKIEQVGWTGLGPSVYLKYWWGRSNMQGLWMNMFWVYSWQIFPSPLYVPVALQPTSRPATIKTQLDILHTKVVFVSSIIICYSINTTTVLDTLSVSSHKNVVTVSKTQWHEKNWDKINSIDNSQEVNLNWLFFTQISHQTLD